MDRYQSIKDELLKFAKKGSDVKAIIAIGSSVRDFAKADMCNYVYSFEAEKYAHELLKEYFNREF